MFDDKEPAKDVTISTGSIFKDKHKQADQSDGKRNDVLEKSNMHDPDLQKTLENSKGPLNLHITHHDDVERDLIMFSNKATKAIWD